MSKPNDSRETRLINKNTFDDPTDSCPAGSNEEADLIAEWQRWEPVDSIQELDEKLYKQEKENEKLKAQLGDAIKRIEELSKENQGE